MILQFGLTSILDYIIKNDFTNTVTITIIYKLLQTEII
jgi:hypothetical protein